MQWRLATGTWPVCSERLSLACDREHGSNTQGAGDTSGHDVDPQWSVWLRPTQIIEWALCAGSALDSACYRVTVVAAHGTFCWALNTHVAMTGLPFGSVSATGALVGASPCSRINSPANRRLVVGRGSARRLCGRKDVTPSRFGRHLHATQACQDPQRRH